MRVTACRPMVVRDVQNRPMLAPRRYATVEKLVAAQAHQQRGIAFRLMTEAFCWDVNGSLGQVESSDYDVNQQALWLHDRRGHATASHRLSLSHEVSTGPYPSEIAMGKHFPRRPNHTQHHHQQQPNNPHLQIANVSLRVVTLQRPIQFVPQVLSVQRRLSHRNGGHRLSPLAAPSPRPLNDSRAARTTPSTDKTHATPLLLLHP